MIETQTEIELIQDILKGNAKAQEILYEKYSKSVKDFLKKKYSEYHDIDDDVSEIMVKVFMKLDTYNKDKSKFSSWVFTIAKYHVIDKWRCNSNNITFSNNLVFDSASNMSNNNLMFNTTNTINTDFESCNSLNYISTQLSPTDYTLLDMKYVQGYNYKEIGLEFNVTSSTISNRVNYIKTKLKKDNPEIIYE